MGTAIAKTRQWGNSLGIVIPNEIVTGAHLRPNEEVIVEIRKVWDIMDLFGSLKFRKTAQEMKEEDREAWN